MPDRKAANYVSSQVIAGTNADIAEAADAEPPDQ
jgi:hypothetical protein